MTDRLELEPSRCWVRQIRRASAGGVLVNRARFAAAPLEGLNGPAGWISCTPERRLNDDGSLTITLPNATGEDGTRHVDRFALLTDPAYRPGEEWLELYREPGTPDDLLFVGTPVEWDLTPTELTLTLQDALVLTANQRASEVDYWNAAAPREVFEHYTKGKAFAAGDELTNGADASTEFHYNDNTAVEGHEHAAAVPAPDAAGGVKLTTTGPDSLQRLSAVSADFNPAGDWEAEARVRILTSTGSVTLGVGNVTNFISGGVHAGVNFSARVAFLFGDIEPGANIPGTLPDGLNAIGANATLTLRLVARGEFIHLFVNGERIITRRRDDATGPGSPRVGIYARGGCVCIVESFHLLDLRDLLQSGTNRGAHHLPGLPPAGGLQASWYDETATNATAAADANTFHALALMPDLEAGNTVLDATIDHAPTPGPWPAPWEATPTAFSARWSGAIRFDTDRSLELSVTSGRARVWIAGMLILELRTGPHGTLTIPSVQAALGVTLEPGGWYPVRIEYAHRTGDQELRLRDKPVAGGAYAAIPAERLSPIGTFTQDVRYESHRDLLSQITEAFGYQWRLEPRTLESGQFPGELVPRVRVGQDTDVVIDDLDGQELHSTGSAADTLDGLLIDASGLANPDADAPGITAEFLLTEIARGHLIVTQGYESLAEISEPAMLTTRGNSLLALRSAPAETIAARPTGQRALVRLLTGGGDVPLTLSGDLARMRWLPGDGVRLDLPGMRVKDTTPRQLTSVAWPCRPDGIGAPTVAFRQRPRGMRALLTRALRVGLAQARSRRS